MGLSEVRRDVTPPVAPSAKKKNIPPRSFGCKSLALAISSWNHQNRYTSKVNVQSKRSCYFKWNLLNFLPHHQNYVYGSLDMSRNHPWQRAQPPNKTYIFQCKNVLHIYALIYLQIQTTKRIKPERSGWTYLPCSLGGPSAPASQEDSTTSQAQQMGQREI